MGISERARTVLSQIVKLHYTTCEPVGSGLISKTRMIPFSSATIRNIMVKLENSGHLTQPHTSAGRLPTDLGYRTYVNHMALGGLSLSEDEQKALEGELGRAPSAPDVLKCIADYMQSRTKLLTFHIPFRNRAIKLKHIHFERLSSHTVLVLWVAKGGYTFQSFLSVEENYMNRALLEKAENYFNNAFKDCSIVEIERSMRQQYGGARDQWDLLLGRTAQIASALAVQARRLEDINFQGVSSLLEMPEFQNIAKVKIIFNLLEEHSKIIGMVQAFLENEKDWIVFCIGREINDPDLEGLTVILSKIKSSCDWLGCVGVVGPKRMPYLESLKILSHAQRAVAARAF